MIETASHHSPVRDIHFVGVDPFEMRTGTDSPAIRLKDAHRLLRATGARIRLMPGDPFTALAQQADAIEPVDLVVVSSHLEDDSLARAWFYVPRLLHGRSHVLWESWLPKGRTAVRAVGAEEVNRLAVASLRRRAA